MAIDAAIVEERIQRFHQICTDTGARMTHQRMEIFKEIANSEEHPDAELIFQSVRKRLPTISLDTVYRTLWWLTGLGLVTTLGPAQEGTRFDANLNRHHHFVCSQCGLTRDFYSEALDNLELPESVASIGSSMGTQVEVKGICHACAAKRARPASNPAGC